MDTMDNSRAVLPVYVSWLKKNLDRYRFLTKDAKELKRRIQGCTEDSAEAKGMYLTFLRMFDNNPFRSGNADIISNDFRCYFIKNQFGMYVPFELFQQLMPYRGEEELSAVRAEIEAALNRDAQEAGRQIKQDQQAKQEQQIKQDQQAKQERQEGQESRQQKTQEGETQEKERGIGYIPEEPKKKSGTKRKPSVSLVLLAAAAAMIVFTARKAFFYLRGAKEPPSVFANVCIWTAVIWCAVMAALMAGELIQVIKYFKYNKSRPSESQAVTGAGGNLTLHQRLIRFVYAYTGAGAKKRELSAQELMDAILEKGGSFAEGSGKAAQGKVPVRERPPGNYLKASNMAVLIFMAFLMAADPSKLIPNQEAQPSTEPLKTTETESTEAKKEKKPITDDTKITDWVITTSACNVRKTPGGEVIGSLKKGDKVTVSKFEDGSGVQEWGYCEAENGLSGYVSRRVMRPVRKEQIAVKEAAASSELKTAKGEVKAAKNVIDGSLLSTWQEGAGGYGEGESLTLTLKKEEEIACIVIYNGNLGSEDSYLQNGRLSGLTVEFDGGEPVLYELPDRYDLNGYWIELEEPVTASGIRFTVESVYEGTKYEDTCITEIVLLR